MICFDHVSKIYSSDVAALNDISFEIENDRRTVLYGPSGSGKTTILSIMAGLISPTSGKVVIDKSDKISFVFQEDRLFRHLNVFDNIAFGLDHSRYSREQIKDKVERIATLTHTAEYLYQKASTLSGGQKQRAAIARALVSHPDILLMDEAFSHLDQGLKKTMILELIEWVEQLGITLVWVSHDFQEALLLAEHMIVIEHGKIVQQGTPYEISLHPATYEIASALSLLGMNEWNGTFVPVSACSFHEEQGSVHVKGWQKKLCIPYKDGYLHTGIVDGKMFCVFSKEKAGDEERVYIAGNKK